MEGQHTQRLHVWKDAEKAEEVKERVELRESEKQNGGGDPTWVLWTTATILGRCTLESGNASLKLLLL